MVRANRHALSRRPEKAACAKTLLVCVQRHAPRLSKKSGFGRTVRGDVILLEPVQPGVHYAKTWFSSQIGLR